MSTQTPNTGGNTIERSEKPIFEICEPKMNLRLTDLEFRIFRRFNRYNDSVCYQRFCCKIEFAVIKKLDMDPSKA